MKSSQYLRILAFFAALAFATAFVGCSSTTSSTPAAGISSTDTSGGLFKISVSPYGTSWGDWTIKWWQWAFSSPVHNSSGKVAHPLLDSTGAYAALGQDGNSSVYFLGGWFLQTPTITRNVTSPSSKSVMFPIINVEIDTTGGWNADSVTKYTAIEGALPVTLTTTIDGKAVSNLSSYKVVSAPFSLTLPADNLYQLEGYTFPAGRVVAPVVSIGYWLMLAPMSKGSHIVHFTGTVTGSGMSQDITYNITVN